MTRESASDGRGGGGGTKKFLYTGPKRKGSLFEDDATWQSAQTQNTGNKGGLSDVWSIQKNITVGGARTPSKPSTQEGWTRNVERGFYSRHGVLNKAENETAPRHTDSPQDGGNRQWGGQPKTFSYSNTSTPDPAASSSLHAGGRYGATSKGGSLNNNNRQF